MKKVYLTSLAMSMAGLFCLPAGATNYQITPDSRLGQQLLKVEPGRRFDGKNIFSADDIRLSPEYNSFAGKRRTAVKDPSNSYENIPAFGYLQGPDGNIWFYTSEFTYEDVDVEFSPGEYFTDNIMTAYKFTFYDGAFKELGTVSDLVEYGPGETRVAALAPDPLLTTSFFNADGDVEVMLYFAVNTQQYINHNYYKVYSIGGQKDDNGNDKSIFTFEGLIIDTTNASNDPKVEDYYFTFRSDEMCEDLDADYPTYVDYLNSLIYRLTVYTKATDDSGMRELFTKDIHCSRMPGDTTSGTYIITKPHNGKMHYVFSEYEKPYFINPIGMAEDEGCTPDNSFTIEVVSTTGNAPAKVSYTKIPVPQHEVPGELIYTYLSIGTVAWSHDIDMVVNGTPDSPAFIVAMDVQNAAEYETYLSSGYYIYGADGEMIKELNADTNGFVLFNDGVNEPQAMYVVPNGDGYEFIFAGLYTGETHFSIDQYRDGDTLSASCDRVPQKDGSYKYAFEMTYYEENGVVAIPGAMGIADAAEGEPAEGGDVYIRVAWYNADGTFDRIDRINMGKDVMAGSVNMAASILQPDLFDNDDKMEYAVMVKRSNGGLADTTQGMDTEFMVVDDNGDTLAHFSNEDGRGVPYSFTIAFGEPNKLMMIYNNHYRYNIDIYELPLLNNGSSGIADNTVANNANAIRFDGATVSAQGTHIVVYSLLGVKVAEGINTLNLASVANGNYIVVATDAAGKSSVLKIAK